MRHTRVFTILCVALAMLCAGALADAPLTPRPEDIPVDQAMEIGWNCMRENSGLTAEELSAFECHVHDLWPDSSTDDGSRYWVIAFRYKDGGMEFGVEIDARDGRVRNWGPSDFGPVYRDMRAREDALADAEAARREWEKEKGPWEFWRYEDKAAFYQQNPGWVRRMLPGPDDMTEAEAVAAAREALAETLLADDAYLDSFRLDIGFVTEWPWDDQPAPCWIVAFRPAEPRLGNGGYALVHQITIHARTKEAAVFLFNDVTDQPVTGENYIDTMFYNPDGGQYFHHDRMCESVSAAYKPLTAFTRGEPIHNETLQRLLPCHDCVLQ